MTGHHSNRAAQGSGLHEPELKRLPSASWKKEKQEPCLPPPSGPRQSPSSELPAVPELCRGSKSDRNSYPKPGQKLSKSNPGAHCFWHLDPQSLGRHGGSPDCLQPWQPHHPCLEHTSMTQCKQAYVACQGAGGQGSLIIPVSPAAAALCRSDCGFTQPPSLPYFQRMSLTSSKPTQGRTPSFSRTISACLDAVATRRLGRSSRLSPSRGTLVF